MITLGGTSEGVNHATDVIPVRPQSPPSINAAFHFGATGWRPTAPLMPRRCLFCQSARLNNGVPVDVLWARTGGNT
jgi:hypothetical protein